MAYRDDFYKAENIIGHTGDISKFPSIYFKVQGNNRATWARVTTDHDNKKPMARPFCKRVELGS